MAENDSSSLNLAACNSLPGIPSHFSTTAGPERKAVRIRHACQREWIGFDQAKFLN